MDIGLLSSKEGALEFAVSLENAQGNCGRMGVGMSLGRIGISKTDNGRYVTAGTGREPETLSI